MPYLKRGSSPRWSTQDWPPPQSMLLLSPTPPGYRKWDKIYFYGLNAHMTGWRAQAGGPRDDVLEQSFVREFQRKEITG